MKTILLATIFLGAAGCAGGNLASRIAQPPVFAPGGQTQCGVHKSQAHPLVVEWPAADRAALESQTKHGLVVVRYVGCEMELLTQCRVKGAYAYTPVTPKREQVVMRNADELFAQIPAFAAKFEGKLKEAGQLNVDMTIVGTYKADSDTFAVEQLEGDCAKATHVASGLTTGAFDFYAGAEAEVRAKASAFGASAGGQSAAKREMLNEDGEPAACGATMQSDAAPPFKCGALLRLDVVAIRGVQPKPAARGQTTEARQEEPSDAPRVLALTAGGVGVLGLGVGALFGLSAMSTQEESRKFCDTANACNAQGLSLRADATAAARVSTVAFALGGAALAGGLVLWIAAPSKEVKVGVDPSGVRVGGAW